MAGRNGLSALIPHKGYRQMSILTPDGLITLNDTLPAPIVRTVSSDAFDYLLLADGRVWEVSLLK